MRWVAPMREPIKAIGYCRVSTRHQAEQNDSLTMQDKAIRDFCAQHDHTVCSVIYDRDVSGGVNPWQRAGLGACILRIEHGEANALVFHRLDRLARSFEYVLDVFAWAKKRRVHLISITENLNTTTPFGRYTLQVMAANAELQRALVGESVKASMSSITRDGFCMTRFAPFGFRLGSATGPWEMPKRERFPDGRPRTGAARVALVPNQEETMLAKFICKELDEKLPVQVLLAKLRNIPNPRREDGRWYASMVRGIARSWRQRTLESNAVDEIQNR
jgi:DNA invertase Pin-like site-specific DNA recombinase